MARNPIIDFGTFHHGEDEFRVVREMLEVGESLIAIAPCFYGHLTTSHGHITALDEVSSFREMSPSGLPLAQSFDIRFLDLVLTNRRLFWLTFAVQPLRAANQGAIDPSQNAEEPVRITAKDVGLMMGAVLKLATKKEVRKEVRKMVWQMPREIRAVTRAGDRDDGKSIHRSSEVAGFGSYGGWTTTGFYSAEWNSPMLQRNIRLFSEYFDLDFGPNPQHNSFLLHRLQLGLANGEVNILFSPFQNLANLAYSLTKIGH